MLHTLSVGDVRELFAQALRFLIQPFDIAGYSFSLMNVWLYTSLFYLFMDNITKIFSGRSATENE